MQPDTIDPEAPGPENEILPPRVKSIGIVILSVFVGGTFLYGLYYMFHAVLPALG